MENNTYLPAQAVEQTTYRIRIKSTPPGEAPEQVRRAWIGLEIPVPARFASSRTAFGVGVLSGPKSWLGRLLSLLTGRAERMTGFLVPASVAVELLSAHSPGAAEWWRQNAPHIIQPGRLFLFAEECCEMLDAGGPNAGRSDAGNLPG